MLIFAFFFAIVSGVTVGLATFALSNSQPAAVYVSIAVIAAFGALAQILLFTKRQ